MLPQTDFSMYNRRSKNICKSSKLPSDVWNVKNTTGRLVVLSQFGSEQLICSTTVGVLIFIFSITSSAVVLQIASEVLYSSGCNSGYSIFNIILALSV